MVQNFVTAIVRYPFWGVPPVIHPVFLSSFLLYKM